MLIDNYITNCFKTWNHNSEYSLMIINASLGVIGEIGELINVSNLPNVDDEIEPPIGECGDLLYYCCVLYELTFRYHLLDERKFSISENISNLYLKVFESIDDIPNDVVYNAISQLAEINKKVFFHHKLNYKFHDWAALIDQILSWLFAKIINEYKLSLNQVMLYNIEKLQNRYPDGFFIK